MDSWSLLCFLAESDSNEYRAYPMLPKAPRKAQTPPPPNPSSHFLRFPESPVTASFSFGSNTNKLLGFWLWMCLMCSWWSEQVGIREKHLRRNDASRLLRWFHTATRNPALNAILPLAIWFAGSWSQNVYYSFRYHLYLQGRKELNPALLNGFLLFY